MSQSELSPTFSYSVAREGSMATIVATGEIDLATSPELRSQLQTLVDDGVQQLHLDLNDVTFIDSSGLGVLVGILKRVKESGADGAVVIRGLNGPVRKVFEITGLYEIFVVDT